jgi:hypothetical protein
VLHAPPLFPQALVVLPAMQTGGELLMSQQPPLQSLAESLPLQPAVEQLPDTQAVSTGQSLAVAQPQAPLTHWWPALPAVQSRHDPLVPHAVWTVPGAQVPALQQPPLQG